MKPLPFPVRIAAGLVAIALEHARDLSNLVITLPVTAASQALQTPRRVQQKVTELAIKGDYLLDKLFPEEEQPPRRRSVSTSRYGTTMRASSRSDVRSAVRVRSPPTTTTWIHRRPTRFSTNYRSSCPRPRTCPSTQRPKSGPHRLALPNRTQGLWTHLRLMRSLRTCRPSHLWRRTCPPTPWTDAGAAAEVVGDETVDPVDSSAANAVLDDLPPVLPEAEDVPADSVNEELAAETVVAKATAKPIDLSEPPVLSGYAEMPIAELRSKLASLELDDLQALLAWEMAHGERPPFVTLLTNRITDLLKD